MHDSTDTIESVSLPAAASPGVTLTSPVAYSGSCVAGVVVLPADAEAATMSVCVQGTWRLQLGSGGRRERGSIWHSEPLTVAPASPSTAYRFRIGLPADLVPSARRGALVYSSYAVVVRLLATDTLLRCVFQLVNPPLHPPLHFTARTPPSDHSTPLLPRRSKPTAYRLAYDKKPVAVLRFERDCFELGAAVSATLDFTDAQVTCHQFSCFLVLLERVFSPSTSTSTSTSASPSTSTSPSPSPSPSPTTSVVLGENKSLVAEQHVRAENLLFCPVSVAVPRDCPNAFAAERAAVSYLLAFEFIVADGRAAARKFCWDCPLAIVAPRHRQ